MKTEKSSLSIRIKIIITILVSTLIMSGLIYFITQIVITRNYNSLEFDEMSESVNRVENIIQNNISELQIKLSDWAAWDDTYFFVQDKNVAYIKSNLGPTALPTIKINMMVFLNQKGDIIFSKLADSDSIDIQADDIVSYIKNNLNLFIFNKLASSTSGIISTKNGDMMIVANPIIKSDGSGPIMGTLIFGKYMDNKIIGDISKLTLSDVSSYPYNLSTSIQDIIVAKENLSKDTKKFIILINDSTIAGYSIIYNIKGEPISILKVLSNRNVFQEGKRTFLIFMIMMIATALMFGIVIIIFIEKTIMHKFLRLTKEMSVINETDDISKRVIVDSDDEVGDLAVSLNNLLDDLSVSQEREKDSIRQEKIALEKTKDQAEETEKLNKLMMGRELKMVELKEEIRQLQDKLKENSG